jgi:DNA-binding transcriptional MerR regulator
MDLRRANFTNADVLRATGLKNGTLQMWLMRGIVRPTEDSAGTGQERRYSATDIAKISVVAGLVATKLAVSEAAEIVDQVEAERAQDWRAVIESTARGEFLNVYLLVQYTYRRNDAPKRRTHVYHGDSLGACLQTLNADWQFGWVDSPEGMETCRYRTVAYEIGTDIRTGLRALQQTHA